MQDLSLGVPRSLALCFLIYKIRDLTTIATLCLRGMCSKILSVCLKPKIVLNPVYTLFLLLYTHAYDSLIYRHSKKKTNKDN